MTQVAEQIKEIYNKLLNNEDLSGYTKPSYMNLINREQEYLKSPNYDKDSEFWKNYVKQMESSKLFNENNLYDYSAKRFEYNLDDSLCQKISTFCQELNITEYAFFLAIISVSINKLYNKSNLVIGTPFLNRLKKYNDLNSTGLYVSTLPLYVSVSDETDFVSLCKKSLIQIFLSSDTQAFHLVKYKKCIMKQHIQQQKYLILVFHIKLIN